MLRHLLLSGRSKMSDVAAYLECHPRSLRRKLRQEGTSFEEIKDEVRYAIARELLRLGALSITDIAITLASRPRVPLCTHFGDGAIRHQSSGATKPDVQADIHGHLRSS